ncbi:MAG: NlpC/P60 family protein [Lachnospiraceae bacterium]|nr:NlpC/P60 family protein [Lachnospiraceae bacterium]
MIKGILKKLAAAAFLLAAVCMLGHKTEAHAEEVVSGERSLGGLSLYLNLYYDASGDNSSAGLFAEPVQIPENVAIAKVNDYLNIRTGAGTEFSVVGFLPKNGMCTVLESSDGWARIKSGKLTGYVSTDYLYTGEEGYDRAYRLATLKATVKANNVNFRSEPDTTTKENILTQVSNGEELVVINECVVAKDDPTTLWVKVYCDDMEGYVAKDFVSVAYDWDKAVSMTEVLDGDSNVGMSSIRVSIIKEAKKHLGLRYVWGGNSLKTGADCSGFCLAVYREVGINTKNLPRTSYDLAASKEGRTVKLSEAQPGDMVFYGTTSGHVNHVALYMGNGQIIHEAGRAYGCKISNVDYRHMIKIKNFLD